jgi:hypothetical protein
MQEQCHQMQQINLEHDLEDEQPQERQMATQDQLLQMQETHAERQNQLPKP